MIAQDLLPTTGLSDKDFRSFFLNSPVERVMIAIDKEGRFFFSEVNTAAANYFDSSRLEMMGRTPRDILDIPAAENLEAALKACARTKKALVYNVLPRFQGGVRMHLFILYPFEDEGGDVRFIEMSSRPEMSDSAQLQRERDDALMLMTSVFDASGLGILVTDRHGRIVRVNDAFIFDYGWTRDELLGEEFTILLPEEARSVTRKLHSTFMERGKQVTREMRLIRKNGLLAEVLATTALIELSQKRRFMVVTVRDMTERKNMMRRLHRAKEEADAANKTKSSFLANMSHELRTPLNAIIGFTEVMKNEMFGPVGNQKYAEYLKDIHFSAYHLLSIINDVLDMSKIEAGKVVLYESVININELFATVFRIMADRAETASVSLEFVAEEMIPCFLGDQRLLRQVLINLVSNAIKFSSPNKSVRISACSAPSCGLKIVVEDDGCGIPAHKVAKVLEPFEQANDPHYSIGQGTGLGLPLAKAMVELHGGTLTLESVQGKGTKVWINFPIKRTVTV